MREARKRMPDGAPAAAAHARSALEEAALPPVPAVDESKPGQASVQLSQHRTRLSTHRTALSEQRTELSMRRTELSFQRTRMSAERTLMSVIRTSLSLIGFGFTIFQIFEKLRERGVLVNVAPLRNFGIALVALGIVVLIGGIAYHAQFMYRLRGERSQLIEQHLIHGEAPFPVSFTLFASVLLLVLGIATIISMVFSIGPFG